AGEKFARPRVIIPVFPGNNCEYDSARAFRAAGAEADVFVINNLSPEAVAESTHELARRIRESQIGMIPGGFSGGDEPDGSAKFITAFFRAPEVTEAVRDLLQARDGLMLGICNGFQALVKLGLVPYG
ncbi:phosphoribosylformylglycinamidine synthase, partial [Escherichia coli]|nr:phosphoribosylformylglycinamidine synthase [Escherichia coli]